MKKPIKILIVLLIVVIVFYLLFILWVSKNKKKFQIPVLMYHNVVYDENYNNESDTITLSIFESQLKYLKENNYKTLTLDEFYDWKIGNKELPEKSVLLTFDDGFYSFHYLVEPLLVKYEMHAVSFVIGSATSDKTNEYNFNKYGTVGKDVIKNHISNVEYESHSFGLHMMINEKQKVYVSTRKDLEEDIEKMSQINNFKYISYPFNTDTDEFIKILKENNYKLAFRGENEMTSRNANNFQIPRIGINNNIDNFKNIFESNKYKNRYEYGFLRKVFITIERKIGVKLI